VKHKRFSVIVGFSVIGPVLAICGLLFCVAVATRDSEAKGDDPADTFAADLQNGNLATSDAFEARCKPAQRSRTTSAGIELYYPVAEIYVTFPKSAPPILESESAHAGSDGRFTSSRTPLSPAIVFDLLECR
jgi:hypothetical protein